MKNPQPLSVDDSASARPAITREFRAKRLTVMVILVITLVLWFTSPIHHLGAAAGIRHPAGIPPDDQDSQGRRRPGDCLTAITVEEALVAARPWLTEKP